MKRRIRRILDWIMFLLSGKGRIAEEGVEAGIIDYSGEGRGKNG